jgi:hypothetical protein
MQERPHSSLCSYLPNELTLIVLSHATPDTLEAVSQCNSQWRTEAKRFLIRRVRAPSDWHKLQTEFDKYGPQHFIGVKRLVVDSLPDDTVWLRGTSDRTPYLPKATQLEFTLAGMDTLNSNDTEHYGDTFLSDRTQVEHLRIHFEIKKVIHPAVIRASVNPATTSTKPYQVHQQSAFVFGFGLAGQRFRHVHSIETQGIAVLSSLQRSILDGEVRRTMTIGAEDLAKQYRMSADYRSWKELPEPSGPWPGESRLATVRVRVSGGSDGLAEALIGRLSPRLHWAEFERVTLEQTCDSASSRGVTK